MNSKSKEERERECPGATSARERLRKGTGARDWDWRCKDLDVGGKVRRMREGRGEGVRGGERCMHWVPVHGADCQLQSIELVVQFWDSELAPSTR